GTPMSIHTSTPLYEQNICEMPTTSRHRACPEYSGSPADENVLATTPVPQPGKSCQSAPPTNIVVLPVPLVRTPWVQSFHSTPSWIQSTTIGGCAYTDAPTNTK